MLLNKQHSAIESLKKELTTVNLALAAEAPVVEVNQSILDEIAELNRKAKKVSTQVSLTCVKVNA